MSWTPAMDELLTDGAYVPDFLAVEILLPFTALRLLAGASQVTFPVDDLTTGAEVPQTFVGESEQYGTIGAIEGSSEGLGTTSPRMRVIVRPPTNAAAAQLNLPTNQMSQVRIWYGVCHPETGVVLGTEQHFWGFMNQPRFVGGARDRAVEYDVSSAMDYLFANEEGQRLNHQTLTRAFPGARGLEYVSDIERQLPWGSDAARSPLISAAGGGYTGGGGGYSGGGGSGAGGGGGGGGRGGLTPVDMQIMQH